MPVTVGSFDAILSTRAVGGGGVTSPLPSFVEVLTSGHWEGLDFASFPDIGNRFEILYPIQQTAKSNRIVFRNENGTWNTIQKSENIWRHEVITLRYKIYIDDLKTLTNFLKLNKGQIIILTTLGIAPFLRGSEVNNVYILDYTSPILEMPKHYSIDVTYLNTEILATT